MKKGINNFKSIGKFINSKGFNGLLILGIAKKLVLLAIWFLPKLF